MFASRESELRNIADTVLLKLLLQQHMRFGVCNWENFKVRELEREDCQIGQTDCSGHLLGCF